MRKIAPLGVAVAISAMFCLILLVAIRCYHFYRDVDCLLYRAQVAADRDDMLDYLKMVKQNMENYSMTHGHAALLFKTPHNDMAMNYKAVYRLIGRLESLLSVARNDTAYQVALDDMRGTIRELYRPSLDWCWVTYWWTIFPFLALSLATIFFWAKWAQ